MAKVEDSDKYFIQKVRPYITKKEMNKLLRPMGLLARGKGTKFGEKKRMTEIYVDDCNRRHLRIVMSGSHYTIGDGQIGVYAYSCDGNRVEIESYIKDLTGRPKRDAEWMLKQLVWCCKAAAHYKYITINKA